MSEIKNKSWDDLYEKYPNLFSEKNKSVRESCMAFGIECNLGWYDILSSLCFQIKQHERNIEGQTKYKQKTDPEYKLDYTPVKFEQIKEKYGGLRIYHYGGDEYVHGLVSMAEAMSYQICEICGEKGKPNKGGWIKTLCNECRSKNE